MAREGRELQADLQIQTHAVLFREKLKVYEVTDVPRRTGTPAKDERGIQHRSDSLPFKKNVERSQETKKAERHEETQTDRLAFQARQIVQCVNRQPAQR